MPKSSQRICGVCNVLHARTVAQAHERGNICPSILASAMAQGYVDIPKAQARSGMPYEHPMHISKVPIDIPNNDINTEDELELQPAAGADNQPMPESAPQAAPRVDTPDYGPAAQALGLACETMRANARRGVTIKEVPDKDNPNGMAGEGAEEEPAQDGVFDEQEDDSAAVDAWMAEIENEWRKEHEQFGESINLQCSLVP
jgi:hypothetical protein